MSQGRGAQAEKAGVVARGTVHVWTGPSSRAARGTWEEDSSASAHATGPVRCVVG
jgi:hypothetical protein